MSDSGDILIRGMKMPVTCCHCPLMGYDPDIEWNDGGRETQGAYICVITHELIDNTKREDHCPLSPAADVVEVVRCKDCKYSEHWYRDKRLCRLWYGEEKPPAPIDVFDDGFCNYGERREDDD